MDLVFTLTGLSPLLHHNPRMVDPEFEVNRQIKALTGKRKKTDEDLRQIEELEWAGGLYAEEIDGVLVVTQPTSKMRKCFINSGKISKQGNAIERALSFYDMHTPLIYDGPKDLKKLAEIKNQFRSRLSVVVGGKRIMRVRPSFFPWALSARALFIDDAGLNLDELKSIVELAGRVEGIGDNRVNGYSRFSTEVKVIK